MAKDLHELFFKLLRTGLVGAGDRDLQFARTPDWEKVYQLAVEQSVQGLVLQGLEWHKEHNPKSIANLPLELLLQWIGEVQIVEQQNKAMNEFVAKLIEILRNNGIYALLVKGQGIAQCYEKPLWRSSGDVDLLVSTDDYEEAKQFLILMATDVDKEFSHLMHQGMMIEGWEIEVHGTLHSRLYKDIDRCIDEAQNDVFYNGNVRSWKNGETLVFLPGVDDDVIFLFTHIIKHFYIEGVGLRQICDWCRFLWTYRKTLNVSLLEQRLKRMGLMSEWRAFAALAVEYLGMPVEAMPLYDGKGKWDDGKWKKKAEKIMEFILETGNFGHKRERMISKSYLGGKINSVRRKFKDFSRHACIFPIDSVKFFFHLMLDGLGMAARGE